MNGYTIAIIDLSRHLTDNLKLLDGRTGTVVTPLPEETTARELAWRPGDGNGDWLAVSLILNKPVSEETSKHFPFAGIYLYNIKTGAVQNLTQTPTDWIDGGM